MRRSQWTSIAISLGLVGSALLGGCAKPEETEEPAAPVVSTKKASQPGAGGAGGEIVAKGSDTLLQVAQAMAEAYQAANPGVKISVSGGGSGTGFQALIEKTCDIANASRQIKNEEVEQAKAKGIEPVENLIGYDGIAVIVNKANPVNELTVDQISDLYVGSTNSWDKLGGKGEVVLVSRDSTSGTYEYFLEEIIKKGDKKSTREFAPSIMALQSNPDVRRQVTESEGAIGYIGLGYVDDSVKVIGVIGKKGGAAVMPSVETVKDGSYPISRPLYMYTDKNAPKKVSDYISWVLGDEGQAIVKEKGFVPK
ncbi:MAG TPA: PstS family phosphate ABC transporter substrate-binding protein [Armatimonadota bacterium]|nr:PstS family phosphate ABC transporter substrate-binding protein [Armatimonadota bacterium]HQK93345.1 PstS family phosphate ABC transporter substrate-binding protein [Armatimonadota bacterium]